MLQSMEHVKTAIIANKEEKKLFKKAPSFAPAGQSTQMVIGATSETDLEILFLANEFYKKIQHATGLLFRLCACQQ